MKKLRYLLEYLAVRTGMLMIYPLPHRALFPLAAILGLGFYAIPRYRRLIIANLSIVFPEKSPVEIRRIAKANAKNQMLTFLEFPWFLQHPKAIRKLVEYAPETKSITEKCLNEKRGLIWATPHLGNWELAGMWFSEMVEAPFAAVVRPFKNPMLEKIVSGGRGSGGLRVIPAKGAVKGMIKALKDGCFMATLVDQNTRVRDGGVFVNFCGLPVPASRAPALFSRKLGAHVAIGGCLRKGRRYTTFSEDLPKPISEYKSDEELIQDIMFVTEKIIRKFPEQYLWMYERWRYIPEDADEETAAKYPFYASRANPRFYSNLAPK